MSVWRYTFLLFALLSGSAYAQGIENTEGNCDWVWDKISSMQSEFPVDNCNMNFHGEDGTPLIFAIAKDNYPAAKKILERGGSANFQNRFGNSPMIWAILHGPVYVRLLADNGWTPDSYANFEGPLARSGFLPIEFGTHIPWLVVASFFHTGSIEILFQHGASLNGMDTRKYLKVFSLLNADEIGLIVRAGADVNAFDREGDTLLHHVVLRYLSGERDLKKIAVLLRSGANRYQKDFSGRNVVEWATLSKDRALFDCLQYMKCI